jgi:glycosyltransferase involved in cell wall biosynthesis
MISDVSFPRVNGVSTSIDTFRRQLHELGHTTALVAPAYDTPGTDTGRVVRIASRPVPFDPEDRLMSRGDLRQKLGALASERFDIIHVHTPFIAHYAGVEVARRHGIPVIETYHTYFEEYFHHYVPFLPRALLGYLARRLTVSQCAALDALVVPSQAMLSALEAYGVTTPMHIIPTGIDNTRFRGGDGQAFRRRYGIDPARPVLAHISRVAHEKNIDFILRAVALILRQRSDVLLVVAGEGPALPHTQRLARELGIADHVLFVGYLDREGGLLDCYRSADLFVYASRTETQGLVLLEALALGVPVVSTAVMGTADVLRDVKGAVVAPDDETAFAATVVKVLADPALRARLAERAPLDAAAWSAHAMAERLESLYRQVIGRGAPGSGARAAA